MIKKLFTLFILTSSLLLSFTSCGDEAVDVDTVNKQTILVFMPWSGDANSSGLTSSLKVNVDSICQGIIDKKGLGESRVMLFFSESYKSSTLYDLQYDASSANIKRIPVKTYNGAVYNSAEGMASIINDVKQQAEALNYAMIIGCHGCGWTYASDWVNYPYRSKPQVGSSQKQDAHQFSGIQFGSDPNNPITRFFGSVSSQDLSIDVNTLAEGIKLSGTKMQYILFDACYMGNVETAYELKDATNYLIATSSEMLAAGIPYRSLWSYLNSATPSYSSIVSGTINYYVNTLKQPYCNMTAVDCRQMDNLASIMKQINSQYSLSSSVSLDSIQPLDGFTPNLFYDMKVYVDSLHPSDYLKDQFTSQLQATIKSAQSTDEVLTTLDAIKERHIKIKSYCGLSISDPSQHSVALKGREKTGWWKATH